jgi:hypothetical protein
MGGRFVVGLFFLWALALMGVDEWGVVVLVYVVPGAVLELAERAARVVMAHVIVIVGVNHSRMRMLMLFVANDTLDRVFLRHLRLLRLCGRSRDTCALLGQMVPWTGGVLKSIG